MNLPGQENYNPQLPWCCKMRRVDSKGWCIANDFTTYVDDVRTTGGSKREGSKRNWSCAKYDLCDCPGLVFPSQVSTKEELVLAGILPLNHIRDHITPVALMCQLIDK